MHNFITRVIESIEIFKICIFVPEIVLTYCYE